MASDDLSRSRFEVDVDDDGLTNFLCTPHRVPACGRCCMDFGLLNQLQPKIPPNQALPTDEARRRALLQEEIRSYFGTRLVPLSNKTGKTTAPEFKDLLDEINSEGQASMESFTVLVAYMCYTARFNPILRGRIVTTLDSLMSMMETSLSEIGINPSPNVALKEVVQQSRAARRAAERAEKKTRKKGGKGKGREYTLQKNGSDMMASIENILEIMGEHNLDDRGSFVSDLDYIGEGRGEIDKLTKLMGEACVGKGDENEEIEVSDGMRAAMNSAIKPLEIMLDHTKDGVSIDNCSTWNQAELLGFLRRHKLDPFPVPSKQVLVALAKEMQVFALSCMRSIESMPEDDEAAALGAQSLGQATPKDAEILERMNAPARREKMVVEPQVSPKFRLDTLEEWIPARMPKFRDSFRILREEWCIRQKIPQNKTVLHHELLQTLENIAYTFDYMVENPGNDMLATIQVFQGTESEQALAVRPLGASIMSHHEKDGATLPIPVILVEWHLSKKVDGIRKAQEFLAGLRKGTLFQSIVPKNLEEFELLVELLKENRRALDVKNETQLLERHCTDKSWKFSVICPADPDRKGGFIKYCRACGKRASNNCSRCGVAPYCCRECQVSDWKTHKQSCKKRKK